MVSLGDLDNEIRTMLELRGVTSYVSKDSIPEGFPIVEFPFFKENEDADIIFGMVDYIHANSIFRQDGLQSGDGMRM